MQLRMEAAKKELQNTTHNLKQIAHTVGYGDEYIATALMFAAGRWGNDTGIDYWKEANCILENMLSKSHYVNSSHVNMFNKDEKQIVFVPYAQSAVHTDPSYHMPAFYELWSKWANNNRQFWKACADINKR